MTYQNAPKLQALLTEVVNAAQRDADRARTDALRARAAERAVPELQRADNTLRESAQLRQRNRQVDAARSYWRAHDDSWRPAASPPRARRRCRRRHVTTQADNQPPSTQQLPPPPTQQNPPVTPRGDPPPAQVNPSSRPCVPNSRPGQTRDLAAAQATDSRGAIQQALNRYAAAHASLERRAGRGRLAHHGPAAAPEPRRGLPPAEQPHLSLSNCWIKDNGDRATAHHAPPRIVFKNSPALRPLQRRHVQPRRARQRLDHHPSQRPQLTSRN